MAAGGVWDPPTVSAAEVTEEQEPRAEALAATATSPVRWLLERGRDGGVALKRAPGPLVALGGHVRLDRAAERGDLQTRLLLLGPRGRRW